MSTAQLKEKLHTFIDRGNESFLKVVYGVAKAYSEEEKKGRITIDQYNKELEEAEAEINSGKYISHKEVKNRMKKW
ncbi:MAG: hypothetical protein A3G23_11355 [Bacteroidetes bacterium RIFCSPLOWO2_12_FULL_37_12]|nr:MAG: hypothetical protein A3G23_11355 [Bacteroidetes bacterium RIFCSPLOWO2_12_FULL_37_12]